MGVARHFCCKSSCCCLPAAAGAMPGVPLFIVCPCTIAAIYVANRWKAQNLWRSTGAILGDTCWAMHTRGLLRKSKQLMCGISHMAQNDLLLCYQTVTAAQRRLGAQPSACML